MSNEEKSQADNVLTIVSQRPVTPTPSLDKIEKYWNVVRANRLVPSRAEIDPRGLEGVLSNAFILERISGGLASFRIAGSHISDLTGLELRQMPISALFGPGSRETLSEALEAVFDDPAIVRMRIDSKSGFGRSALSGEMIMLPLRSDIGAVDRVLGGIALDGKIGRTPRRLEIQSQSRKSLTGYAGPAHMPSVPPALDRGAEMRRDLSARVQDMKAQADTLVGSHLKLVVDNT